MAEVQFKVSLCGIYGGKIGTGTEFSRSTFCFSWQYSDTGIPYSFTTGSLNNTFKSD